MTYPYGLRGAPAVGLGIPGLPIRQIENFGGKPKIGADKYRVLAVSRQSQALLLDKLTLDGEIDGSITLPYPGVSPLPPTIFATSEDDKYALVGSDNFKYVSLVNIETMEHLATVEILANRNLSPAINSKLGLLAFRQGNDAKIYTIESFIAADGGAISSVTPADQLLSLGQINSLDWSKNGDLFLATTLGSSDSRSRCYTWPAKQLIHEFQGPQSSDSTSTGRASYQGVSPDSKRLIFFDKVNSRKMIYEVNWSVNPPSVGLKHQIASSPTETLHGVGLNERGEYVYVIGHSPTPQIVLEKDGNFTNIAQAFLNVDQIATTGIYTSVSRDGKVVCWPTKSGLMCVMSSDNGFSSDLARMVVYSKTVHGKVIGGDV